jgi:TPR repeat protein
MRLLKIFNSILFLALANIVQAQEITPQVGEELFIDAVKAFETKDFQTAIELFSLLAEQGEPTSQHNLSLLYLKGLGSPVNYRRALRWAGLASLGGNKSAPELIDDIRELITEDLIDIVAQEIVTELTEKAMAGDKGTPEKLGKTYYQLFVTPDLQKAYIWLLISQAFGHESPSQLLKDVEEQIEIADRISYQDEALETFGKISK